MTRLPARPLGMTARSERPRKAEDVLADVGEDEVRRDRRHLIETSLAKLPLDVVLGGEAEAAMRLEAHVRRLPRRVRGQHLGHVRFAATGLTIVEETRSLVTHEI